MPRLVFIALFAALFSSASHAQQPFRHDLWEAVLQQHVSREGLVDYKGLKAHPEKLFAYVESLAKQSPDNAPELFPTEAYRLAYWINAYNALIVNRVVRNYPVRSIRDLGGLLSSVFKKTQVVGGKTLSHDDIEHRIIRTRFREPRVHFLLNCASRSCAPLRRHALTAENLESTLQQAAVEFLNNPANVRLHPEQAKVELSAYFKWFDEDFLRWLRQKKGLRDPNVLDYVKIYLSQDKQDLLARTPKWDIDFLDYDWTLNEVP